MKKLEDIKHIHFVGIKGVGMASLALCAQDLGIKVTGSDVEEVFVTDPVLKKRGINFSIGFSEENLKQKPDLVITTGAHGGLTNLEVKAAKKLRVPVMTHAEALGFFANKKDQITVCGVGGKTTVSSMVANLLDASFLNPSFAIGVGEIFPLGVPGRFDKEGRHFICEADEFAVSPGVDDRPRFSFLSPKVLVVTNIEHDHPDIYPTLEDTKKTFREFFEKVPSDGVLIANLENNNIAEVIKRLKVPLRTFGFSQDSYWQILKMEKKTEETTVHLREKDRGDYVIRVKVPGEFNALNAVAAFAVGKFLGIDDERLQRGISSYRGCKRRFEKIGVLASGAILYDDYAHHPKELTSVLKAAKEYFPQKRIVAVFQPHTYTRTKALFGEFARAFSDADIACFMDIYSSAREKKDESVSSEELAKATSKYHSASYYIGNHKSALAWLGENIQKDDLVLTLGAGDIFYIHEDLLKE